MAGQQFADATPDGVRRGDAVGAEIPGDGPAIELGREPRHRAQGLQLGTECEQRAHPAVVQRFLTEAVPHEVELSVLPVPQGCGEHPLAGVERPVDSPALHGRHHHLRVGSTAEPGPGALQSVPELRMVVDLSVVRDHPSTTGGGHGLRPAQSEIDDGQATVTEGDAGIGIDPDTVSVRTTMLQRRGHRRGQGTQTIGAGRRIRVENAGNPAHAASARSRTVQPRTE